AREANISGNRVRAESNSRTAKTLNHVALGIGLLSLVLTIAYIAVMNQQPPAQPGIVTVQPTVYVTQAPLGNPVSDYMCYSIFTMLCCCLPLGIAALIYSIN
uniref:Si:ch73-343g19.4 n=1 Tax=Oryzias latipes TaxID=8090 RepID=H2LNM4_ORYLA